MCAHGVGVDFVRAVVESRKDQLCLWPKQPPSNVQLAPRRSLVDSSLMLILLCCVSTPIETRKQVLEIRRPRQHSASGGGQQCRKRRQTLQTVVLECAAGNTAGGRRQESSSSSGGNDRLGAQDGRGGDSSSCRETVLFHLWDEQTCLTSLFRKGDGLAVYWPWLVQQQPRVGDAVHDSTGERAAPEQQPLSSQVRTSNRRENEM